MTVTKDNFIRKLKKKKEEAFEYVVDEYLGSVKAVVYNRLGSYHDSALIDECINDTFLGAWQNSKQFSGDAEDFRRWICTIAKFKAIDHQRRIMKQHIPTEIEDYQLEKVKSAETSAIKAETTRELLAMMDELQALDRDIFMMKYLLDMKHEEIAWQLGLSKAAVDNRLYRGRQKLKNFIIGGSFS